MSNLAERLLSHPQLLADYEARTVSVADIAARFNASPSYVLSTLSRLNVKRPRSAVSTYALQKRQTLLARTRREFRAHLAKQVLARTLSLAEAALMAQCSERTMRRYVKRTET